MEESHRKHAFILRSTIFLFIILSLSACGGGSGDGPTNTNDTNNSGVVDKNVALSTNGASATATYDNTGAALVNDGDTTTSNYWAGNITGDTVTVDFGKVYEVKRITVYTNDTSFSSSNPSKIIEVSDDNVNWYSTAQVSGADVPCFSLSFGSGKIDCGYSVRYFTRYVRVRVTAATDVGLIQIHEIEAIAEVSQ